MMQVQQAGKEKVSYWLEWRQMGTSYYATMQVEEPDSKESRNPSCVKRIRLTKEEANMPLIDLMQKYPRVLVQPINYKQRVTMPVRDMERDGKIIFAITIYGLTRGDISVTPGGGEPFRIALERMGLDTLRYQVSIWDTGECESHNYEPPAKRK